MEQNQQALEIARNTLTQTAYWQINKAVVKAVKIEAAVLLTDLVEKYFYVEGKDWLVKKDGKTWFYFTSEDIEKSTTLTYSQQKTALKELAGIVETKLFGVPAKLHYCINFAIVKTIVEGNYVKPVKTSIKESSKLELGKVENKELSFSNTLYKENNNYNQELKTKEEEQPDPPTSPLKEKEHVEEPIPLPPSQTYGAVRAELFGKTEMSSRLPQYLQNMGIYPSHPLGEKIFAAIFDKWFAHIQKEKGEMAMCDGTEESICKMIQTQFSQKVSIYSVLHKWTTSSYSKSDAQNFLKEHEEKAKEIHFPYNEIPDPTKPTFF